MQTWLRILVLLACMLIVSACKEQKASNGNTGGISKIRYEIIGKKSSNIGGQSNVTLVVISPEIVTEEGMTDLAQLIKRDFSHNKLSFVYVYDNKEAALSRADVLSEQADQVTTDNHDKHMKGAYLKNEGVKMNEFVIYMNGCSAPSTKKITF